MENSAYVPSSGHLNSPALVVFSQAAGGLQDALRIQRPFNPQFAMSEASKELHRPFSSSFGLRHMEAYGGLPAHILNHLQPQFLHPGLSLGSGAFRPLADLKAFPSPSAFAPPKCLKIETNSETVHHGHGIFSPSEERFLGPSPRTDSCSPASASMSPQPQTTVKEESLDAHMSEDGDGNHGPATDNDSPGIHDDNRGFRIGPLFGGGFSGSGGYTFSVPGLPPAAHALAKTSFLFDHVIMSFSKPYICPFPNCGFCIEAKRRQKSATQNRNSFSANEENNFYNPEINALFPEHPTRNHPYSIDDPEVVLLLRKIQAFLTFQYNQVRLARLEDEATGGLQFEQANFPSTSQFATTANSDGNVGPSFTSTQQLEPNIFASPQVASVVRIDDSSDDESCQLSGTVRPPSIHSITEFARPIKIEVISDVESCQSSGTTTPQFIPENLPLHSQNTLTTNVQTISDDEEVLSLSTQTPQPAPSPFPTASQFIPAIRFDVGSDVESYRSSGDGSPQLIPENTQPFQTIPTMIFENALRQPEPRMFSSTSQTAPVVKIEISSDEDSESDTSDNELSATSNNELTTFTYPVIPYLKILQAWEVACPDSAIGICFYCCRPTFTIGRTRMLDLQEYTKMILQDMFPYPGARAPCFDPSRYCPPNPPIWRYAFHVTNCHRRPESETASETASFTDIPELRPLYDNTGRPLYLQYIQEAIRAKRARQAKKAQRGNNNN